MACSTGNSPPRLLEVGLGAGQGQGTHLAGGGVQLERDVREHEVAVVRAPAGGVPGPHVEPQRAHPPAVAGARLGPRVDGVGVVGRPRPGDLDPVPGAGQGRAPARAPAALERVQRAPHHRRPQGRQELRLPGCLGRIQLGVGRVEPLLRPRQLAGQPRLAQRLLGRRRRDLGRRRVAHVGGRVEEGVEPVVLALGEGVVLVGVALGAGQRRAEPDRGGGVHAVDHRRHAELLGVGAALGVDHRVAVEAGGDALVQGRLGQQVAGQLLDREAVEGQVAVVGVDDPVAVAPQGAPVVLLVAVGVGVARQVQPAPRPGLAVARGGQQPVDGLLPGVGAVVGQEGVDLRDAGRQADQVQAEPAQQGGAVGLGHVRGQAQQRVHRVDLRPGRQRGPPGSLVGPVSAPVRPLLDPAPQGGLLGLAEPRLLAPEGRHDLVLVLGADAVPQLAAHRGRRASRPTARGAPPYRARCARRGAGRPRACPRRDRGR